MHELMVLMGGARALRCGMAGGRWWLGVAFWSLLGPWAAQAHAQDCRTAFDLGSSGVRAAASQKEGAHLAQRLATLHAQTGLAVLVIPSAVEGHDGHASAQRSLADEVLSPLPAQMKPARLLIFWSLATVIDLEIDVLACAVRRPAALSCRALRSSRCGLPEAGEALLRVA